MWTLAHETSNMESAYCMGIPNLLYSVMPAYVIQDNTMYHMCVYYRLACKYILSHTVYSSLWCSILQYIVVTVWCMLWQNYLCNGLYDIIVALKIERFLPCYNTYISDGSAAAKRTSNGPIRCTAGLGLFAPHPASSLWK